MVNYRRSKIAGGSYFFTVNLRDRSSRLLAEHAEALRAIVRNVRRQWPFKVDAMVLLPEHWHAVWTLRQGDADYAGRITLIKRRFTRYLKAQEIAIAQDARGETLLWQKRFWEHTIRNDRDFENHVSYIHINPVKHGHVKHARDWPHSTIHRYIGAGDIPPDWACGPMDGAYGE